MALVVRDDSLTTLTPADGDYTQLRVGSTGALHVTGGGGGTEYTEDVATANPIVGTATMIERDDILSTVTPAEGDNIGLRGSAEGALWTQDFNSDAMLTSLQLLDDAISGNEMQVDIVAALPAGTNNIGDVDVLSIIPGTGSANLGKAIDSAKGSTDTGVVILVEHVNESHKSPVAESDWDNLHMGELGGLYVEPEQHNHFDELGSTSGWTALGNDTLNLATTKKHLSGTDALTFDKVNGAANTVFAGIQKTITSVDLGDIDLHDTIQTVCYLSSISNVNYVFIRIGTDSTNYNEWRVGVGELTAGEFIILGVPIGGANFTGITGNGIDWTAITYIVVGVAFNSESDALSEIIFDQLGYFTGTHTTTSLSAEVTSSVNTANINLKKIGGSPTDKNSGNASVGSQRVVIATDDVNMAIISGWDNAASDGSSVTGDVAHDGVDAGEPVKIGGRAQAPTAALEEVADNDRVDAAYDRQGRIAVWNGYDVQSAIINDSTSGNNTIQAAAGAGLRIALIGCVIVSDGTTDVRWEDGAGGTAFTGQIPLQAREGFVMPIGNQPWFVGSADTLLNLELTANVNVHGIASFVVMTD